MAREKSAWERMREREKEREEEERADLSRETRIQMPNGAPATSARSNGPSGEPLVIELMARADVMMEQIQNLYNMYLAGLERTPPVTQRKQFDDLIVKVGLAPKPTPALLFRVNQFNAKVHMYREKWDRTLRDVESGKIVVRRKSGS